MGKHDLTSPHTFSRTLSDSFQLKLPFKLGRRLKDSLKGFKINSELGRRLKDSLKGFKINSELGRASMVIAIAVNH